MGQIPEITFFQRGTDCSVNLLATRGPVDARALLPMVMPPPNDIDFKHPSMPGVPDFRSCLPTEVQTTTEGEDCVDAKTVMPAWSWEAALSLELLGCRDS